MSEYRINRLGIFEQGTWKRNKKHYPHILPIEKQNLNLLQNYQEDLSNYIKEENIHLHQDFHHLNSSQAVCLNFFYPMIEDKQTQLLLQLLNLENEIVDHCEFEKVISKEEGTNFDFYVKLKSGKQVFFEVKYTETGFGKVIDNAKYRKKYEEVYKTRLANLIKPGISEYETLIKNYQLLRNISYVNNDNDNLLIIICPRDNTKVHQEYEYVIGSVIVSSLQTNIRLITWEKLLIELKNILKLASSNIPNRFLEHYSSFEEKYKV